MLRAALLGAAMAPPECWWLVQCCRGHGLVQPDPVQPQPGPARRHDLLRQSASRRREPSLPCMWSGGSGHAQPRGHAGARIPFSIRSRVPPLSACLSLFRRVAPHDWCTARTGLTAAVMAPWEPQGWAAWPQGTRPRAVTTRRIRRPRPALMVVFFSPARAMGWMGWDGTWTAFPPKNDE